MHCSAVYFRAAAPIPLSCTGQQRLALKINLQESLFSWYGSGFLSRKWQCTLSVPNRSLLQLADTDRSNTTHSSPPAASLEIPALTTPKPNFPSPSLQPQSPPTQKYKSKNILQARSNDFQYHLQCNKFQNCWIRHRYQDRKLKHVVNHVFRACFVTLFSCLFIEGHIIENMKVWHKNPKGTCQFQDQENIYITMDLTEQPIYFFLFKKKNKTRTIRI